MIRSLPRLMTILGLCLAAFSLTSPASPQTPAPPTPHRQNIAKRPIPEQQAPDVQKKPQPVDISHTRLRSAYDGHAEHSSHSPKKHRHRDSKKVHHHHYPRNPAGPGEDAASGAQSVTSAIPVQVDLPVDPVVLAASALDQLPVPPLPTAAAGPVVDNVPKPFDASPPSSTTPTPSPASSHPAMFKRSTSYGSSEESKRYPSANRGARGQNQEDEHAKYAFADD